MVDPEIHALVLLKIHPMGVSYIRGEYMNIRELRTQLGDTQSEFASRYRIPYRTVQNWEAGVRTPPQYVIDLLLARIQVDLINRKTAVLPTLDARKADLPARSNYIDANWHSDTPPTGETLFTE